jgi:rhamnogalacturonyl hydrolase YesR
MFWVQEGAAAGWNRDRGTGPTGGAAKLALNLYELTGQASYRDWGKRAYDWVNANLLTKTGEFAGKLYWDKIRGDGSLDTAYWSYNQGVMIGAGVLLHRITGDPAYLDQAVRTADAALDYYGNRVGWYSQPVIFNVLFFRNLLMLYALNGNLTYLNAVQGFADKVWNDPKVHNQQKHLIKFEEWTSAYKLREQAAMVQIYAGLAWDPSRSNRSVYSKLA